MPSNKQQRALSEIRDNIELARYFIADHDLQSFGKDVRTRYAVTRCLEIISEASRRLPADLKDQHPAVPWKDIAGAGNVYRHEYEQVSDQMIWDTVQALEQLLEVVLQEQDKR